MRPSRPWILRITPSADEEAGRLPHGPKTAFRELVSEIAEDPLSVAGMRAFRRFRDAYIVNFYTSYRLVFQVFRRSRRVEIIAADHRDSVYKGMPNP